jgi:asparagine synthetase B (glutamine-hydrolysing)
MFFIAITKEEIAQNFQNKKIEEFTSNSLKITICIDKFLSNYFSEPEGFSVIESPLLDNRNFRDLIFSKVTYNENQKTLTVIKSTIYLGHIYYHISSQGDFFCSTHISMMRQAGVPIEENTDFLPEFFAYRYVMPSNTLYKNINFLFSGGKLHIKIVDGRCTVKSIDHYNPPMPNKKIKSIKNSSKIVYNNLSESIEKLTSSKDRIAILFSGGIDSSIISSICQKKLAINTSYSTGYPFEDPKLNFEKSYALSGAEAFGLNHHYYEPTTKEYIIGFLEAIASAEEPLNHLQSVLLYLLFKNGIPHDKKIIVNGSGGAAYFGNVDWYLYWKDKTWFKLLSKKPLIDIYMALSNRSGFGKELKMILDNTSSTYPLYNPKNFLWLSHIFGNIEWICRYFNVTDRDIIKHRYDLVKKFEHRSIYDIWSLISLFGDEGYTNGIWYKSGEVNKKIMYAPLYDFNVLNHVFSISWKAKLKRPRDRLRREIARRCNIPEFIITRPKRSFGVYPNHWARKGGVFEPLIPLASKIFDENEIRSMQSAESKKAMTYWNMLNYSIWKRLFIRNEPLEILLEEITETI